MSSPMETQDFHSSVDASRPFSSVKEAVAVFGQQILVGEFYSQNLYSNVVNTTPPSNRSYSCRSSSSPPVMLSPKVEESLSLVETLKKLEEELKEMKKELKLLKERESETEVALASLNAELHKNMSKLAVAEAAAAKKAAEVMRRNTKGEIIRKEERRKEMLIRMENLPTLAEILSLGEEKFKGYDKKERKVMKKKPIIPLVGDLLFSKKKMSSNINNPLYTSPNDLF